MVINLIFFVGTYVPICYVGRYFNNAEFNCFNGSMTKWYCVLFFRGSKKFTLLGRSHVLMQCEVCY